jgi:hypothetical protein
VSVTKEITLEEYETRLGEYLHEVQDDDVTLRVMDGDELAFEVEPVHWEWVERNGMWVRPAKGNWNDLDLPPDRPRLTEEEIDDLLRPDREDQR